MGGRKAVNAQNDSAFEFFRSLPDYGQLTTDYGQRKTFQ
jgi:hypothetical protein